MDKKLLVATHNQGKVKEFAEMLTDLDVAWFSLTDAGVTKDVAETGETFRDNAILKARTYAQETGLLTLADDSGLEVDALNGQPGVYTARYGGKGLSPVERYQLLLANMRQVAAANRTARFRAVIALAQADGTIVGEADGVCEGFIAIEPSGEGGFGYDPIFYLPEWGMTMAEVGATVKHQISHRGQALKKIEPLLRALLVGKISTIS
jgi:XTP/dITP diphosphohydrolase